MKPRSCFDTLTEYRGLTLEKSNDLDMHKAKNKEEKPTVGETVTKRRNM